MILPLNKKQKRQVLAPKLRTALQKSEYLPRLSAVSEGPTADTANVFIWDDISSWWGVNKVDVLNALNQPGITEINLYVSSFGGEISEAFVIYDLLKGHPAKVTAYLTGFVCSAGTLVSCAADEVVSSLQCIYMIHRAQWYASGDADQLRKAANILERIENRAVDIYRRKTGQDEETIRDYMAVEEWFEPEQALEFGFVDTLVEAIPFDYEAISAGTAANSFDDDWWWYFKADEVYTLQGMELIKNGYKPVTNIENSGNFSIKNKINMSKLTNSMASKIISFLFGAGYIDKNNVDEATQKLTDSDSLIADAEKEILNKFIKERVKLELEENDALETGTSLGELIDNASDEELEQLREKLGTDDGNAGQGTEGDDAAIKDLENKIGDLTKELAKLQGVPGQSNKNKSNGPGPAGKKAEGDDKNINNAQLKWLIGSYDKGNLTASMFKQMAGMTYEEAKKLLQAS